MEWVPNSTLQEGNIVLDEDGGSPSAQDFSGSENAFLSSVALISDSFPKQKDISSHCIAEDGATCNKKGGGVALDNPSSFDNPKNKPSVGNVQPFRKVSECSLLQHSSAGGCGLLIDEGEDIYPVLQLEDEPGICDGYTAVMRAQGHVEKMVENNSQRVNEKKRSAIDGQSILQLEKDTVSQGCKSKETGSKFQRWSSGTELENCLMKPIRISNVKIDSSERRVGEMEMTTTEIIKTPFSKLCKSTSDVGGDEDVMPVQTGNKIHSGPNFQEMPQEESEIGRNFVLQGGSEATNKTYLNQSLQDFRQDGIVSRKVEKPSESIRGRHEGCSVSFQDVENDNELVSEFQESSLLENRTKTLFQLSHGTMCETEHDQQIQGMSPNAGFLPLTNIEHHIQRSDGILHSSQLKKSIQHGIEMSTIFQVSDSQHEDGKELVSHVSKHLPFEVNTQPALQLSDRLSLMVEKSPVPQASIQSMSRISTDLTTGSNIQFYSQGTIHDTIRSTSRSMVHVSRNEQQPPVHDQAGSQALSPGHVRLLVQEHLPLHLPPIPKGPSSCKPPRLPHPAIKTGSQISKAEKKRRTKQEAVRQAFKKRRMVRTQVSSQCNQDVPALPGAGIETTLHSLLSGAPTMRGNNLVSEKHKSVSKRELSITQTPQNITPVTSGFDESNRSKGNGKGLASVDPLVVVTVPSGKRGGRMNVSDLFFFTVRIFANTDCSSEKTDLN